MPPPSGVSGPQPRAEFEDVDLGLWSQSSKDLVARGAHHLGRYVVKPILYLQIPHRIQCRIAAKLLVTNLFQFYLLIYVLYSTTF